MVNKDHLAMCIADVQLGQTTYFWRGVWGGGGCLSAFDVKVFSFSFLLLSVTPVFVIN